jgi:hypothetical protein
LITKKKIEKLAGALLSRNSGFSSGKIIQRGKKKWQHFLAPRVEVHTPIQ